MHLQAALNAQGDLEACTEAEREILLGPRHVQPQAASWDCAIPLVLVDVYYEPVGELPRPALRPNEDHGVIWLSPATEEAYLRSLAESGVILLGDVQKK